MAKGKTLSVFERLNIDVPDTSLTEEDCIVHEPEIDVESIWQEQHEKTNGDEQLVYSMPLYGRFIVASLPKSKYRYWAELIPVDDNMVLSTCAGVVMYVGWENPEKYQQGKGLYIKVKDFKNGLYHYYCHLSEAFAYVGQVVTNGDEIGVVGDTGQSICDNLFYYCTQEWYSRGKLKSSRRSVVALTPIKNCLGLQGSYRRYWESLQKRGQALKERETLPYSYEEYLDIKDRLLKRTGIQAKQYGCAVKKDINILTATAKSGKTELPYLLYGNKLQSNHKNEVARTLYPEEIIVLKMAVNYRLKMYLPLTPDFTQEFVDTVKLCQIDMRRNPTGMFSHDFILELLNSMESSRSFVETIGGKRRLKHKTAEKFEPWAGEQKYCKSTSQGTVVSVDELEKIQLVPESKGKENAI
jgi:hypothetical protein